MPASIVLDVILILLLLGYLLHGFRAGLILSLGGLIGIVLGVVAAFFAIPGISSWIGDSVWRVPVILGVIIVLVVAGQALGSYAARLIRRPLHRTPLKIVDRVLGAVVNVVVAALLMSTLAFSLVSLGIPFLSQAVASSAVIRTIDSLTPDPVESFLAQLRTTIAQDGLTRIIDALEPDQPLSAPDRSTDTPALNEAARSVVKITGDAYRCGQDQLGSGFVAAPQRVVTNAHVVAGVTAPVVQTRDGGAWPGRIVYFDPDHDLAVIAVPGLPTKPLEAGQDLSPGDFAAVDGYPLGGPFQAKPATVHSRGTAALPDIYGDDPEPVELYTLAADVQEGNSGGPLLSESGAVAGIVFAKSANQDEVGYALTMQELGPVMAKASTWSTPVASGHCTRK